MKTLIKGQIVFTENSTAEVQKITFISQFEDEKDLNNAIEYAEEKAEDWLVVEDYNGRIINKIKT